MWIVAYFCGHEINLIDCKQLIPVLQRVCVSVCVCWAQGHLYAKYILCHWAKLLSPIISLKRNRVKHSSILHTTIKVCQVLKKNLFMFLCIVFILVCLYVWVFVHMYLPVCGRPRLMLRIFGNCPVLLVLLLFDPEISCLYLSMLEL